MVKNKLVRSRTKPFIMATERLRRPATPPLLPTDGADGRVDNEVMRGTPARSG